MKKTNRNLILLSMIFAVSLIISNVVTAKTIQTGIPLFGGTTITIPGAALCYAITFLMTDVIGEIWGKKEANQTVALGFICQIIASLLILFTQYLPAVDNNMQQAYTMLLGQNWVFVIGSLVAYLISQSWDVYIFHKLRDKYIKKHGSVKGGRWIWNNASTMTSQILDTIIFIGIAFGLGFGWLWNNPIGLLNMFVGQYLVKFILSLLDTPFFYLITRTGGGKHRKV